MQDTVTAQHSGTASAGPPPKKGMRNRPSSQRAHDQLSTLAETGDAMITLVPRSWLAGFAGLCPFDSAKG